MHILPENTWITSDTHYLHANIIIYCKRMPFFDPTLLDKDGRWISKEEGQRRAEDMTDFMIEEHNKLVAWRDPVLHLGDFAFGKVEVIPKLIRRLHGNFYFVFGNHDKALQEFAKELPKSHPDLLHRVKFLGKLAEVNLHPDGQNVTLCHYAMRTWNKSHRGSWHVYGHSHGTLPDDPTSLSLDVGVDCHGLKPINLTRLRELMAAKTYKPVDHHGTHKRL